MQSRISIALIFNLCLMIGLEFERAIAGDWPQWRGPKRNGISSETNWRTEWPADRPNTLWRASLGAGFSSIAVSNGRAYTMGNIDDRDTIWCLNALSGKEIWRHSYDSPLGPKYYEGGPGSTPTIHGNRAYSISKWGDIFCLDAATGKVAWHKDLRKEPGLEPNEWGFAGSPLIYQDIVIFNAGSAGIALNQQTGKIVWSTGKEPTGDGEIKWTAKGLGLGSLTSAGGKLIILGGKRRTRDR